MYLYIQVHIHMCIYKPPKVIKKSLHMWRSEVDGGCLDHSVSLCFEASLSVNLRFIH